MSLVARVTAGALAVVALVLGGGGAVILAVTERQDRRDFDAALRRELDTLGPPVRGSLGVGPPGAAPTDTTGPRRALTDAFGQRRDRYLRASAGGRELQLGTVTPGWRTVSRTDAEGVTMVLGADPAPLDARISDLRRVVLMIVVLGVALAAAATLAVTRVALRGIHAAAAEREASLEAARRFAADAGHELRTPLQSVRSNLEIAQRADGEARQVALDTALAQSGRLSRLVDALQSLARGEAGLGASASRVDLGEVADGAVFAARTRHPGTTITLDAPASGPLLEGDSDGLWRLLENLIENAALHGGDTIRVTVRPGLLAVDDDGPGVPPEDRRRLTERFARGGHVNRPGSGLGLAIVGAEARRHGGGLELTDSELGGLRAVVTLR